MAPTYYPLWYRLDQRDNYLIWFSDDADGIVTQPDGAIPSWSDLAQLHSYATQHHINVVVDVILLHDLDAVVLWLRHSLGREIECDVCLTAWNLFTDCAASVNRAFDQHHKRSEHVYNKLFWGNNLPSVTPASEHFAPIWTDDERLLLQEILDDGLQLFRTHITHL